MNPIQPGEKPMSFHFVKANCVVVGTFNIYVLQPRLLADLGLLEKDRMVLVQTDMCRPGFKFEFDAESWAVWPDRLVYESTDLQRDYGGPVATVLEALRWTPLVAIGFNLEYKADLDLLERLPRALQFPRVPEPVEDVVGQTQAIAVKKDDRLYNVLLSRKEAHLELSMNAHSDIPKHLRQPEANSRATDICRSFADAKRGMTSLAQKWLELELPNA